MPSYTHNAQGLIFFFLHLSFTNESNSIIIMVYKTLKLKNLTETIFISKGP